MNYIDNLIATHRGSSITNEVKNSLLKDDVTIMADSYFIKDEDAELYYL